MDRKDIERRVRLWEAEGYDVSELKAKWFSKGGGGRSPAWIVLPVVAAVVVLLILLSGWSPWSSGQAPIAPPHDPSTFTLTTAITPSGSGSVSPSSGTYDDGTRVTLTASRASDEYRFSHWSGDATGTSTTITVTMNNNKSVTAHFIRQQYTLTIAASPAGSGTTAPAAGSHTYDAGTRVTLTASEASGYRFGHWSGDAMGTSATTTVTMDRDRNVTANFIRQYTLTIAVSPAGSGTTAPAVGSHTYDAGTGVTLTASPASGHQVSHWSGDASGANRVITLTMDSDKSAIVNFERLPPQEFVRRNVSPSFKLAKELNEGDTVEFSVMVDRTPFARWGSTWGYRIDGPQGLIRERTYDYASVDNTEGSFTADHTGSYSIVVFHNDASWHSWDFSGVIWPPGWH